MSTEHLTPPEADLERKLAHWKERAEKAEAARHLLRHARALGIGKETK